MSDTIAMTGSGVNPSGAADNLPDQDAVPTGGSPTSMDDLELPVEDDTSTEMVSDESVQDDESVESSEAVRKPAKPADTEAVSRLSEENNKLRGLVTKLASYPEFDKVAAFLEGKPLPANNGVDPDVKELAASFFGTNEDGELKPGAYETMARLVNLAETRVEQKLGSKFQPYLQATAETQKVQSFERGLRQAGVNPVAAGSGDLEKFAVRFKKANPWIKSVERDDPTQAGALIGKAYKREQKRLRDAREQQSRVDDARDVSLSAGGGRGARAGELGNTVRVNPNSPQFNLRSIERLLASGKKIV